MDYKEAFEALNNGDFKTAAAALGRAAEQTGYTSDIINHAYTLALYRSGDNQRLADVAFRVGNHLIGTDPASAMDYFQRALVAGLDRTRVRNIGEIHEEWQAERGTVHLARPIASVGHIVGCLRSDDRAVQQVKLLVAGLKARGVKSTIFTTEGDAAWFFNPEVMPRSAPLETGADIAIAAVDGDFLERAEKIAAAIRAAGIPVVLFHGDLSDQIMARVAAFRPAPIQINVNHGAEMDADLFDGFIHLHRNELERTRFESHPSEWIPLMSDAEERLQFCQPVTRQTMGLESSTSVSATFGNLNKVSGSYLKALAELMKRSPRHFHIFAGAGNVRAIRGHLHSEGVLPRIRFLGIMPDVVPMLEAVDVYLASFPQSATRSILEAMAAGKPVVVLRSSPDSPHHSGSELVGAKELTARNEAEFVEIADRLIRNPALRSKYGQMMRERFRLEFRPARLADRYIEFLNRFQSNG